MNQFIIVDDDASVSRALARMLEAVLLGNDIIAKIIPTQDIETLPETENNILIFQSANEAWDYISRLAKKPNLIISDVNMPGMSGLELFEAVKTKFPDIIFAIMTGIPNDHRARANELGVNIFLEKPFGLDSLRKVIDKTISV